MLQELRIYTMYPDRMDTIIRRFADHTLTIFQRMGMKVTQFWIDAEGKQKLYYVLEYDSREQRDSLWNAFRADPEWKSVRAKSEEDGPIVEAIEEYFMNKADFYNA